MKNILFPSTAYLILGILGCVSSKSSLLTVELAMFCRQRAISLLFLIPLTFPEQQDPKPTTRHHQY